jgi:hypothetical protein
MQYEDSKRAARYAYMSASSALSESVSHMSASFQKSLYVTSPQLLAAISSEIWSDSAKAWAALGALPSGDQPYEQTQTFISRAGDYAYYLASRAAAGERPNAEELEALRALSETAKSWPPASAPLKARCIPIWKYPVSDLATLESEFPEYSMINYDGAMSEDAVKREVKLTGAECSADQAKMTRANALGLDSDELTRFRRIGRRRAGFGRSRPTTAPAPSTSRKPAACFIPSARIIQTTARLSKPRRRLTRQKRSSPAAAIRI